MSRLRNLYARCKESESNLLLILIRAAYLKLIYGKSIYAQSKVIIRGIKNISIGEKAEIGILHTGFIHKSEKTYLNIRGKLNLTGNCTIGKGCRFDIIQGGVMQLGHNSYINANTRFIIAHKLIIGDDCAISWDCEFIDDDFHNLHYPGKKEGDPSITIGNKVWIGSDVRVLKGTRIPNGCVVASGSIVKGDFSKENCLIAGSPAKVIKEGISWS